MSNLRITDLPVHLPEEHNIVEMASFDDQGITRRLRVGEHVYSNEEEAIKKVREIFDKGFEVFIMPFKP